MIETAHYTAFDGSKRLASGAPLAVALACQNHLDAFPAADIFVFDDLKGRAIDLDLRGGEDEITQRYAPPPRAPGRPKLGVVAREITLLPRHWEWLAAQPGGASPTLRKLIDAARKGDEAATKKRLAQTRADGFMMARLGDQPGYEDAARALYAGDEEAFRRRIAAWPNDLRQHVMQLAAPAFAKG